MCLDLISEKVREKYKNKKFGWKVFVETKDGKLLGDCCRVGKERPVSKWLDEKDFREIWNKRTIKRYRLSYPTGWHIFLRREDAREWSAGSTYVLQKVRFRKPTAWGTQNILGCFSGQGCPIVVAKEMFIERRN